MSVLELGLGLLLIGAILGLALRPTWTNGQVSASRSWIGAVAHARRVSAVAWVALLVVPVVGLAFVGRIPAVGVGLLPTLAGGAFLAVHAAGELTWPRHCGAVRRAPLVGRRVRDVMTPRLAWLLLGWVVALGVLLLVCAFTSASDGRSLWVRLSTDVTAGAGPYPGPVYGIPIALAVAAVLAGCAGVVVLVVRRPAVGDTLADDDLALRRLSVRRVLAGVQLIVAWTLAGCLAVGARALASTQAGLVDGQPVGHRSWTVLATFGTWAALAVGLVGLVVGCSAMRAPRRPDPLSQRAEDYRQPVTQPRA